MYLSWASSIQSIPSHPTSWISILISCRLHLGLSSGLFPPVFPTNTMFKHLLPLHLMLTKKTPNLTTTTSASSYNLNLFLSRYSQKFFPNAIVSVDAATGNAVKNISLIYCRSTGTRLSVESLSELRAITMSEATHSGCNMDHVNCEHMSKYVARDRCNLTPKFQRSLC